MTMFLLVSCLFLSVVFTTASTADTDQSLNHDTMEYLIRRIEVLENRDLQFREEMNAMRRKQDRQGRMIDSLRRVLGSRNMDNGQSEENIVHEDENKQSRSEVDDASSTVGETNNPGVGMQRIRKAEVDMDVAFFVKLSADIPHLGQNQIVPFETIETNEGNAYDPHVGVFTAPVTGTYVFSTTLVTKSRDATHYGFDLNGNLITRMFVDGVESFYESSSQTIVLQLKQGDDVSIKHLDLDKTISGANYSIFSGFLLHQSFSSVNVVG